MVPLWAVVDEKREAELERKRQRERARRLANLEELRARSRAYTQAHPAENRARAKAWALANKARVRANRKRWVAAHREQLNGLNRKWRKNNAAKMREFIDVWKKKNPDKTRAQRFRDRSRREQARGFASAAQILERVHFYGDRCAYCDGAFEHVDHVIPLSRGGTNWPANLRPACRSCNTSKGARSLQDFLIRGRLTP